MSHPVGDTTGTPPRPPICLSVDHAHTNDVVTSDDRGLISLCKIGDGKTGMVRQWKGHAHEAWIAIFGSQQDTVLSGEFIYSVRHLKIIYLHIIILFIYCSCLACGVHVHVEGN